MGKALDIPYKLTENVWEGLQDASYELSDIKRCRYCALIKNFFSMVWISDM